MRAQQWLLVHGYFDCEGVKLGHAWLLHEGKIFCPTFDRVFDEQEYYDAHHTVPLKTYTATEAAQQVIEHKHFGPWSCDDDLLVGRDNS